MSDSQSDSQTWEVRARLEKLHSEKAADALKHGQLLPHEATPSVKLAAVQLEQTRLNNDKQLKAEETRIARRMSPARGSGVQCRRGWCLASFPLVPCLRHPTPRGHL